MGQGRSGCAAHPEAVRTVGVDAAAAAAGCLALHRICRCRTAGGVDSVLALCAILRHLQHHKAAWERARGMSMPAVLAGAGQKSLVRLQECQLSRNAINAAGSSFMHSQ